MGGQVAAHGTFLQFFCCLVCKGTMKKLDDEIPTTGFAGLTDPRPSRPRAYDFALLAH